MAKFTVLVEEFLSTEVDVEANSKEEALAIVKEKYNNEKIVLTADDCYDTAFYVGEETTEKEID